MARIYPPDRQLPRRFTNRRFHRAEIIREANLTRRTAGEAEPEPEPEYPTVTGTLFERYELDASTLYSAFATPTITDGTGLYRMDSMGATGKYFLQNTAGARPVYRATGGPNDRAWLEFTAASSQNLVEGVSFDHNFMHKTGAWTVFMVVKPGKVANPDAFFGLWGSNLISSSNVGCCFFFDDRSSLSRDQRWYHFVSKGTSAQYVFYDGNDVDGQLPANQWSVISVRGNTAAAGTARTRIRVNTATFTINTGSFTPSAANSTQTFRLGSAGGTAVLNGGIAAWVAYSTALSDADQDAVVTYLLAKY